MQTFVVLAVCVVACSALPQSSSLLEEIKEELLRELDEKESRTLQLSKQGIYLDQTGGNPDKVALFVERELTIVPTDLCKEHRLQLHHGDTLSIELTMKYGSCLSGDRFNHFTVEGKKYVCSAKGTDEFMALAVPERHSPEVVIVQRLILDSSQLIYYLVVHCTDDKEDACQHWYKASWSKIYYAVQVFDFLTG